MPKPMDLGIAGRCAVVTGASSGLDYAVCEALARDAPRLAAAIFSAAKAGSFLTGIVLPVDGGMATTI